LLVGAFDARPELERLANALLSCAATPLLSA